MKKSVYFFAAFFLVTFAFAEDFGSSVLSFESASRAPQFVPGEFIIKFKTQPSMSISGQITGMATIDQLNTKHRIKYVRKMVERQSKMSQRYGLDRMYLLKSESEEDVNKIVKDYKNDPNVEYAEPNYIVNITLFPNDPNFNLLYGLHNTGQDGGVVDADIDAPEAWDNTIGSSDVTIAVIDTGVDYNHEDLVANIWTNPSEIPNNGIDDDNNGFVDDVRGWDFANNDNDPMDDQGHGTHVSGTIGAVGNNGKGVAGVNWKVRIIPIKFLSSAGSGTIDGAVKSINYAILMGADIMSNSWGGTGFSQALLDAIKAANDADILFVAAAGNDGFDNDVDPVYPASYDVPNVVSVAATDKSDDLADFSDYGRTSVDLGAPGVGIISTVPTGTCALCNQGGYRTLSGTSMATPHVSGVAALIKSRFSKLNADKTKSRLLFSVDRIDSLDGITVSGGRLNALNSLESDNIPPTAVTDLNVLEFKVQSAVLEWTSTGDDASSGTASAYDLRRSNSPIDNSNWDSATKIFGMPKPKPAGSKEIITVKNLAANKQYYFALKVLDNVGNPSELSNVAIVTTKGITSGEIGECLDLVNPNFVYDLINDVESDGACFKILADNVTLDCHGFNIWRSKKFVSSGIDIIGYSSTTIKSCNIIQNSSHKPENIWNGGIHIKNSSMNDIFNNTLTELPTFSIFRANLEFGVYLDFNANNNKIYSNNIITGKGGPSSGMLLLWANNNSIYNNTITTSADPGASNGIDVVNANKNNIYSNKISSTSLAGRGIFVGSGAGNSANNNIHSNIIKTTGSGGHGIDLHGDIQYDISGFPIIAVTNNSIYGNTIVTSNDHSHGISLYNVFKNNIYDNDMTTQNTAGSFGIYSELYNTYKFKVVYIYNNSFSNNKIRSLADGIVINGRIQSSFNTFTNDKIIPCSAGCAPDYKDIVLTGKSINIIFTNVSFDKSKVAFPPSPSSDKNNLTVKWFMDINIINETNDLIQGALVKVVDASGISKFIGITDANGKIPTLNVTDFVMNGSVTFNGDSCFGITNVNIQCKNPYQIIVSSPVYITKVQEVDINNSKLVIVKLNSSTSPSFSDNFTRADSTILGNGWYEVSGDFMILNNQLSNNLNGTHIAFEDNFISSDMSAAAEFTTIDKNHGPSFGIILRYRDSKNYYLFYRSTGSSSILRISKIINGVETVLAKTAVKNPAINVPFRIEGRAVGNKLTLYFNGKEMSEIADSTFSSGKSGIYIKAPSAKNHIADNYVATKNLPNFGSSITGNFIKKAKYQFTNLIDLIGSWF